MARSYAKMSKRISELETLTENMRKRLIVFGVLMDILLKRGIVKESEIEEYINAYTNEGDEQ